MARSGSDRPGSGAGARPSPNIWYSPETYELENRCADPDRRIEAAMRSVCRWDGADFLDLGCGSGFHLPRWADDAAGVTGVEPHPDLCALARRRTRRHRNITVRQGTASKVPVPTASVDVAQARWAYFFGPGCEPGLAELARVLRPGGTAFVVDNDSTRSTFGGWFRRGFPEVDPLEVERFWAAHGWARERVDIVWRFDDRAQLTAVVGIELPHRVAAQALADHPGLEVDYAVNLWWRRF